MQYCKKCGAQLEDDAKVCTACGAPVEEAANGAKDFSEKVAALNNTADHTDDYDAKDIEDNKLMGILAYLGILVLIPIFAAKESKFARFHANQGLILLICSVIISAVSWIPILGWIVGAVGGLIVFILMIIGIINVVGGRAKELPVVGKYTILK